MNDSMEQSSNMVNHSGFIRGLEGETPVSADFKVTSEGQTILATVGCLLCYHIMLFAFKSG